MEQGEWLAKPAREWTIKDLVGMARSEEGPYLEFKKPSEFFKNGQLSLDLFSSEVAETVSAFLNSDGGVLLIGVQTDRVPGDRRNELLRPMESWVVAETFEHLSGSLTISQIRDRIYSNLMPRPFGVEVETLDVPLGDTTSRVFVVTVPRSQLGAHQSLKTYRYYKRTVDRDVPMMDYEIQDVNNRRAGPLLYLECAVPRDGTSVGIEEWKASTTQTSELDINGSSFSRVKVVVFAVTNLGRGTANVARFDIGIPQPWQVHAYSPDGANVGAQWVAYNALAYLVGNRVTIFWRPDKCREIPPLAQRKRISEQYVAWEPVIFNGNQPPAHPIWSAAGRVVVGVLSLRLPTHEINNWWWLPWRAFTEGMPETRGAVLFKGRFGQFETVNYEMDDVGWWGETEDLGTFDSLKNKFQVT